jgi:hypothetical protein
MQDISNTALKGIRKFFERYPLKPPHVTNIQRHTDPNEKVGSVPLPLLQKTMEFAPGSPHWVPFLILLTHSMHTIIAASKAIKPQLPVVYKEARNVSGCSRTIVFMALISFGIYKLIPEFGRSSYLGGVSAPWSKIGHLPKLPTQLREINFFDTMRLSANIAHDPAPLTTSHKSPYVVIA